MSDTAETKKRFTDCYQDCFDAYNEWLGDKDDIEKRDELMDTMHELRRVLARIEIDLSKNQSRRRNEDEAMPVPSHRARKHTGPESQSSLAAQPARKEIKITPPNAAEGASKLNARKKSVESGE